MSENYPSALVLSFWKVILKISKSSSGTNFSTPFTYKMIQFYKIIIYAVFLATQKCATMKLNKNANILIQCIDKFYDTYWKWINLQSFCCTNTFSWWCCTRFWKTGGNRVCVSKTRRKAYAFIVNSQLSHEPKSGHFNFIGDQLCTQNTTN